MYDIYTRTNVTCFMSRYAYHECARDFTMKLIWTLAFSWCTEGPKRHALQAVLAAGLSSETLSEIPEMHGLTLVAARTSSKCLQYSSEYSLPNFRIQEYLVKTTRIFTKFEYCETNSRIMAGTPATIPNRTTMLLHFSWCESAHLRIHCSINGNSTV